MAQQEQSRRRRSAPRTMPERYLAQGGAFRRQKTAAATTRRGRMVAYGRTLAHVQSLRRARSVVQQSGTQGVVTRLRRVARAARSAWFLVGLTFTIYLFQFAAGVISIVALAAEIAGEEILFGLGAALLPGWTIFVVGYGVAVIISLSLLLLGVIVFSLLRIAWWPRSILWLMTAFCGSFLPLFNMLPWAFLWYFAVVYAQTKS